MLSKVMTIALSGIEAIPVEVEVNINNRGLPSFDVVGISRGFSDSIKHRVKTAILNSGIDFPNKKITVSLAPADVLKEGSYFDLPIAIGVIAASKNITLPENTLFYGELSLGGSIRSTKGVLILALYAKSLGMKYLFVPADSANEASIINQQIVIGVRNLNDALDCILDPENLQNFKRKPLIYKDKIAKKSLPDFREIIAQEQAKRALQIAVAGRHNILMFGPPGVGKSMLASSILSIMPPLSYSERLEVTKIYSLMGLLAPDYPVLKLRPMRSPHHSISYVGMVGGGRYMRPGEITLAHRGVLFLDELAEFQRPVIESLRQPLETGSITVSRSQGNVTFPASFMLVAATNPCPCGYEGHPEILCSCSPSQVHAYKKKISGPIMDRIDLHIYLNNVSRNDMIGSSVVMNSAELYKGVAIAVEIQKRRYNRDYVKFNSELSNDLIKKHCVMTPSATSILLQAVDKYKFSTRVFFKLQKIARTIADLEGREVISIENMAEAIQYRTKYAHH